MGTARFIIVSSGRSGSRLLVQLLAECQGLACDELIPTLRQEQAEVWLRAQAKRARGSGYRAYGARLLVPHLVADEGVADPVALIRGLAVSGWGVLRLERSDPVRTAVSYVHAVHRGFHVSAADSSWRFRPFRVDEHEFSHWLDLVSEWKQIESRAVAGLSCLTGNYERALAQGSSQVQTIRRIMDWLGVAGPVDVPIPSLRRQLPDRPLKDLVENYQELRQLLNARYPQLVGADVLPGPDQIPGGFLGDRRSGV